MEENTFTENNSLEVSEKMQKEIKKTVDSLKEKDPKLKRVYPIVVKGDEGDEKEEYVGYFRQPSFASFSKYLSASQSNQAVAMRTLAKDCFLEGDRELIEDDSLFLFGLMGSLGKVIEMRNGTLVNLLKPGK
jgi:hypothetical protein